MCSVAEKGDALDGGRFEGCFAFEHERIETNDGFNHRIFGAALELRVLQVWVVQHVFVIRIIKA